MRTATTSEREPKLRIAYLNTRYPALSHTFIQREIEGLRSLGAEIRTFSIRRPAAEELGAGADASEIEATTYILDPRTRFLAQAMWSLLAAPWRACRAIASSQRLSSSGVRERLRHVVYAFEGMVLARLLRRHALRSIHVHMANNGAAVAMLAAAYDGRLGYSLTIHGSAEFFDVVRLSLRQKVERASFVRYISWSGQAHLMALTPPSTWTRFHVVHCGLQLGPMRHLSTGSSNRLSLLAVGRLTAIKGYAVLLQALKLLATRGAPWHLRIAGDGPDRESLEGLAQQLGIADAVHFLGPLAPAGVADELGKADLLVVSSFMEGIPVVLMEAMAAGVPVVATRVGGVPELIRDGVNGLLVDPGSPEALADALEHVARDRVGAAQRAEVARRTVETSFDLRATTAELLDLFRRYGVVASSPDRGDGE